MINGYIPAARFLPFLSWTDVAALPDKSNTVIVLPTGAIEQHGPHLPCSVDSVISSGVAGHASPGYRRRSRPTPSRRSSTVSQRSICIFPAP
ncbi:Creatinine amidohydrolase [Klebsiella quasipneumoniae]|nr:Creatinine amidohydrolase [Klebsiella quasipneumoniae]